MTQYNNLNGKLSNSQLNKLKPGIKKWYWSNFKLLVVILMMLSNVVGDSNDDTNLTNP